MSFYQAPLEELLSQSRHTCTHCQKLIIDPENSSKPVKRVNLATQGWIEFRNTFEFAVAVLLQASQDACPVFERLVRSIDADSLCSPSNGLRSVNIHLDMTSSTSDTQMTAANVKRVKIDCRWMDTDESVMDYDAFKRNAYAFEAEADDAAGVYVLNRPSYPYVVSDITFEIIRTWLQECEAHDDCIDAIQTLDDGVLIPGPSRLLYLEPSATGKHKAKIIDAQGTERYTALSYCWGKDSSMQLLRSTLNAWKEALPIDDLPQTIQDAIFTTRRLGLEYLWVDRICIIQDDREDTKKELSAMAQIYQRSFLTISAASAPSAIDGFLQSRSQASDRMRQSRTALGYRCPDGSKGTVGIKTIDLRNEEFVADLKAVDARAWTMQEQMLSTRIIHFCTNMLFWKCLCGNGAHMHKEGVAGIPSDRTYMEGRDSRFEIMKWGEVVRDYTQRNLSFPADKLVAISALADKFAQIFKTRLKIERPRYLAGLWEHELRTSLCWYLDPNLASPHMRSIEYRAPSWSWASVDGTVTGFQTYGRGPLTVEILACSVEPVSVSMPYLSVLTGYLTLKGRLREDIWDRKRQKLLRAMGRSYLGDDAPDGLVDALEIDLPENEDGTIPVFCLLMGEGGGRSGTPYGLILVKEIGNSKLHRRVGYFELELFGATSNFINFSFKDCEEQIVTIV